MAQQLGQVAVGSIVKINENGSPVDFYVAKHDYESVLNGAGRTLVVRKDCYDDRMWNISRVNAYGESDIDAWFNDGYKELFSQDIQAAIGTTRFYYTDVDLIMKILTRAIFALSATELGGAGTYIHTEGAPLPIASTLKVANMNGAPTPQWTRSPYTSGTTRVWASKTNGDLGHFYCNEVNCASRPAFTLPASIMVREEDGTIITEPPAPSTLTVPGLAMQGQLADISWSAVDGADSYILERNADNGGWTQIYSGANLSYTDTIGAWSTVQYRVKAGISSVYGDYATSDTISVVAASALVISGTDSDLGTLTGPVQYSVSSDTGNAITVTETVNGVALRTYTATSGQQQSIAIPDLPTGSGSIVITASVQASSGTVNQTRTWSYTKTAPTFPSGPFDISTLSKGGKTQFPLTLAEAVKMPLGMSMVGVQQHIEEVYTGDTSTEQVAAFFNNLGPGTACTEKPTWDEENQIYVPKGATYTCSISGDPEQTNSASGIWAYYVVQNQAKYYITNSIRSRYYYASTATHAQSYYFSDVATLLSYEPAFEDSIVSDPNILDLLGNPVGVQIETGSYTGTGTYGTNNPNRLTFDFEPQIVFIKSSNSLGILVRGYPTVSLNYGYRMFLDSASGTFGNFVGEIVTFGTNTVSWYNTGNSQHQMNESGTGYAYYAIGTAGGGN